MEDTLKISLQQSSLTAILELQASYEIDQEFKVLLGNLSEQAIVYSVPYQLPWSDFIRGIRAIAAFKSRNHITVQYDDKSGLLIREAAQERLSLTSREANLEVSKNSLSDTLARAGFSRGLNENQVRDALRLLSLKHGANFSVPGAGKTATLLGVYTYLRETGKVNRLFVVTPINAFISWEDEVLDIFKVDPPIVHRLSKRDIEEFRPSDDNAEITLVNYEKMRRGIDNFIPYFLAKKVHFILDESHRIKSGSANISYNQIIKLADVAKRRDILSGTPMPQKIADLKPQFDFLWPGEEVISPRKDNDSPDDVLRINQQVGGLFVRTTKIELGLRHPNILYKNIEMGPLQKELYSLFKSEAARVAAGLSPNDKQPFRKIGRSVMKMVQAAANPVLLSGQDDYDGDLTPIPQPPNFWEVLNEFQKFEKPTKIEYLRKRVREILEASPDSKVLVWTYFVRNILTLERLFDEYNPVVIYGSVVSGSEDDEHTREARIRKFHRDNSCRIMIANPQACGEGISLHKVCHHAIYLDRTFNAAYYLQSIDRIHRLGLVDGISTTIEILIADGSIDEVVNQRLMQKIDAMGVVLDDAYLSGVLAYDPADISKEDESGIDDQDVVAIKKYLIKQ